VHRTDNLTTFMCRNVGILNLLEPRDLSRPIMGSLLACYALYLEAIYSICNLRTCHAIGYRSIWLTDMCHIYLNVRLPSFVIFIFHDYTYIHNSQVCMSCSVSMLNILELNNHLSLDIKSVLVVEIQALH